MDIKNLQPFVDVMNEKFIQKKKEGYTGWDDLDERMDDLLIRKLYTNIEQEDWVDVANIAAIRWWRRQKSNKHIEPTPKVGG